MKTPPVLPALAVAFHLSAALAAPLPRSAPEEQGVSSKALLGFVDALDRGVHDMNSVMVVRHGRVVAEGWWAPYRAGDPHELWSLSKSFTSTAVGLAVAEGRLSVDDTVASVFPDAMPEKPSANLASMRMRDLLTMTTGHQDEPASAADRVSPADFLAQPVPHKPGTHFKYNSAATFMQSAAVQRRTGQRVVDYLQPRLFGPLGIEGAAWRTNFQGVDLGGSGLRLATEDIAKFGQLYLQKGRWGGRQLLPASWVDAATARQVSNGSNPASDWDQGYGFQFWRCRHGAYRGDGAFGQYCVVLPEQDAVLVITSGVRDMQRVLDVAWEKLLPAFQPRRIKADPKAAGALKARLGGLSLPMPSGTATVPEGDRILGRRIVFPENARRLEWMSVRPADDGKGWVLAVRENGAEWSVPCGHREWRRGRAAFAGVPGEVVAGSAAWASPGAFEMLLCAPGTAYNQWWHLGLDGTRALLRIGQNVGFGAAGETVLEGRVE